MILNCLFLYSRRGGREIVHQKGKNEDAESSQRTLDRCKVDYLRKFIDLCFSDIGAIIPALWQN